MKVVLINYESGNIFSMGNSVRHLGYDVTLSDNADEILAAERLILPGVGAFGQAMEQLAAKRLVEPVKRYIASGKPFIGVCVGLQMLFDASEESPGVAGLGVFQGTVDKFRAGKIPHMGWNKVECKNAADSGYAYFAHSYHASPRDASIVAGWTESGSRFPSLLKHGNVTAFQFHPEKSGEYGLRRLRQFLEGA